MKHFDIGTGAIGLLSALYFFCGFSRFAALISAVCAHELGHIAAMLLFGARPRDFRIDISGLSMSCSGLGSGIEEAVILLSGPLSGFALALLCSKLGNLTGSDFLLTLSGFSLILTAYNLLPILPLDGGRLLSCALNAVVGKRSSDRICRTFGTIASAAIAVFGGFNIAVEWGRAICMAGIILLISQMK